MGKSTGYNHFEGDLDEVAVHRSALPAMQVRAHYAAGPRRLTSGATPPCTPPPYTGDSMRPEP